MLSRRAFLFMGLIDQIKEDIKGITTNTDDFAVTITLMTPNSTFDFTFDETFQNGQITIKGLHSVHHMKVDAMAGTVVNSRHAYCSFYENAITDQGYPMRNASKEVNLKNHRVVIRYSTGEVRDYFIREWFPDETVGLIVCILGDYKILVPAP